MSKPTLSCVYGQLIKKRQFSILVEYSEGLLRRMVAKFKPTTGDDEVEIRRLINRFDTIKHTLLADRRDIEKYTYEELKAAIGGFQDLAVRKQRKSTDLPDPIITVGSIKVYKVLKPVEAIRLRTYFEEKYREILANVASNNSGKITWCVARDYPDNVFFRYTQGEGIYMIGELMTFYFIEDESRDDRYIACALRACQKSTDKAYATSVKNDGDYFVDLREFLQQTYPALVPHINQFVYQAPNFTPLEVAIFVDKTITAQNFAEMATTYEIREAFISSNQALLIEDFKKLEDDLKSLYIELRASPTANLSKFIKAPPEVYTHTDKTTHKIVCEALVNSNQLLKRFKFIFLRNMIMRPKDQLQFLPITNNGKLTSCKSQSVVMYKKRFVGLQGANEVFVTDSTGEIITDLTTDAVAKKAVELYQAALDIVV